MTTLTKTYPTELAARRAVQALRATGVPERDIRLLVGSAPRDIRHEPVGGFAGPVAPHAPVGTYGDRVVQRARAPAASPATPTTSAKARSRTPTASSSSPTKATPNARGSPASAEPAGSCAA